MSSESCNCPTQPKIDNNIDSCPICLFKFNDTNRLPLGLNSRHNLICQKCAIQLHPNEFALVNLPLLTFLGYSKDQGSNTSDKVTAACQATISNLIQLARRVKLTNVTTAMTRTVSKLLVWLTPTTQKKLIGRSKSLANRILFELVSQNQCSNYRAQQQLWSAIRARSCQFMGPALQDEALKLVLLALEDGSALSRKVLIMFIVQRLNPEFPQASKTSIGHVIQLLYRSGCFQFMKQGEETPLMTLNQEFRSYEAIRREHDTQIIKIGLDAGLHFTQDQWSQILYGDNLHKVSMQSILDKLTEPQTFKQLTKEFLITIQRLQDEDLSTKLLEIYPCFEELSSIDPDAIEATWEALENITDLLLRTLEVLLNQKALLELNRRRPQAGPKSYVSRSRNN